MQLNHLRVYLIFSLALALSPFWVKGQTPAFPQATVDNIRDKLMEFMKSGDFSAGVRYFEEWKQLPGVQGDTALLWEMQIDQSLLYIGAKDADSAAIALGQEPAYLKTRFPVQFAKFHIQQARIYLHSGELHESADELELVVPFIENQGLHPDHIVLTTPLINLGIAYNFLGEYDKAILRLERARALMEQESDPDPIRLSNLHYNLGSIYSNLGDWDRYMEHMTLAHDYNVATYGLEHTISANSLNSMANGVKELGDPEGALEIYLQTLAIFKKIAREDHPQRAVVELNIGETYYELGEYDEALPYLQASAKHRVSNYGYDHYRVERAYKSLGQTLAALGRFDDAIAHLDTALMALGYDEDSESPYAGVEGLFPVYYAMSRQAEILHRKAIRDNTLESELEALAAYEHGMQVLKDLRLHYKGRLSQGNLNQKSYLFYEPAIGLCFDLFERTGDNAFIEKAFLLADESKDNDFYNNYRQRNDVLSTLAPADVVSEDEEFQNQLNDLASREYDLRNGSDSMRAIILDSLSKLQDAYAAFVDGLSEQYPEYFEILHRSTELDVTALHGKLATSDAVLLNFFVGDSLSFAFVVDGKNKTTAGTRFDVPADVNELISSLRDPQAQIDRVDLDLPGIDTWIDHRRIVIVPDGILCYLPFEIIRLPDGEMLIAEHAISYETSARAFLTDRRMGSGEGWLGIAPDYDRQLLAGVATRGSDSIIDVATRAGWIRLPGAQKEVRSIAENYGGDTWLGDAALESQFKREAGNYDILHLSMHAWLSDEEPLLSTLVFSEQQDTIDDGYLYAHEIIGLELPARMAVLSACQTGLGTIRRGEGIQSLARSFRTAGVGSTVMSLWKVPDESTSAVMTAFYQYLHEGLPKDIALQKAKLRYIENVSEPELAAPYYWAGFVLNGDTDPLYRRGFAWWIYALGILGITIAGYSAIKLRSRPAEVRS